MQLSPVTLALISLRGAALGLELQGQSKASDALFALADAAEAGQEVEEHMEAIAAKLKDRNATDEDWADVTARIAADSDRLQKA